MGRRNRQRHDLRGRRHPRVRHGPATHRPVLAGGRQPSALLHLRGARDRRRSARAGAARQRDDHAAPDRRHAVAPVAGAGDSVVVLVCEDDADAIRASLPDTVSVATVSPADAWDGLAEAAQAATPADVVVVAPGVRVAAGWLDGLLRAAGRRRHGRDRRRRRARRRDLEAAAARLLARTRHPRPRSAGPAWACTLVTRAALELAGPLDDGFAERCSAPGCCTSSPATCSPRDPEAVRRQRGDEPEPVARRERGRASCASRSAVTVDARILRAPIAGTQVHTLELLAALHRTGELRLRALVPPDPTPTAAAVLDALDGLELLDSRRRRRRARRRRRSCTGPTRSSSALDLLTLRQVGERLVVTHQDLLDLPQPRLPRRRARRGWRYRRLTARGARRRARASSRSPSTRPPTCAPRTSSAASACASCRSASTTGSRRSPPSRAAPRAADAPRRRRSCSASAPTCATRTARSRSRCSRALRERHGWHGRLVLAGPHAAHGSSAGEEAALLAADPELADARRRRRRARRGREGVAVRARRRGACTRRPTRASGSCRSRPPRTARRACSPPQAALAETLGDARDARAVGRGGERRPRARRCCTPGPERDALVAGIRAAGERLTWDATAARAARRLRARRSTPPGRRVAGRRWRPRPARRTGRARYWALRNDIGADRPRARRRRTARCPSRPAHARRARPPPGDTRARCWRCSNALGRLATRRRLSARNRRPQGPLLALTRLSTTLDNPPVAPRVDRDAAPGDRGRAPREDVPAPAPALLDAQGARAAPVPLAAATTSCGRSTTSRSRSRAGEFFGIVGRNGSGKSTLLKCLAGIYNTDAGDDRRSRAGCRRSSSSASASTPT